MVWLVVPVVLMLASLAALVAIRSLESARRTLQARTVALAEARAELAPVQRRIARTRADTEGRARR